jgi:hypothetical protein
MKGKEMLCQRKVLCIEQYTTIHTEHTPPLDPLDPLAPLASSLYR